MYVLYGLRDVALVIACGVIAMLGSHAGIVRQLTGVVGIAASASLAANDWPLGPLLHRQSVAATHGFCE